MLGDKALRRARQLAQLALHGGGIPALTALGATLAGRAELRGFEMEVDAASRASWTELAAQLRDPGLREPLDPRRPASTARCGPIRRAGWAGCCACGGWAWARCWRTTWAWARRCS